MEFRPKKSLGQNFLKSPTALKEFVDSCNLTKEDIVLEIGAGTGVITRELANRSCYVIAVEFDRDLVVVLKENLKNISNVKIVNKDVLEIFNQFLFSNFEFSNKRYKVVGAIPYDITSPLIHAISNLENKPTTINLIVQYEVAKKICAKVPHASYLSNLVATFGEAKLTKKIPPGAFYPAPKVNSAILKITTYDKYKDINKKAFSEFLHNGFRHPRKKIKQVFQKEELQKAVIDSNLRPENLELEQWLKLFKIRT